jgi:hypothetical protein
MSDYMMSEFDPNLLAQLVGQQYNPYQGYPLKQVSDQMWDVYGPTPDYLIAQQYGMMTPNREDFSLDAFFQADPMLRGPMAQALALNKGDTIGAYNEIQGPEMQAQLRDQIGRTEWDQLAYGKGDLASIAASTPEEKDDAAMDYYMRGLESLMAGGAPTSQGAMQQYDMIAERMGGMPYPGAGQTEQGFEGPGFAGGAAAGGGGGDPMAEFVSQGQPWQNPDMSASKEGTPFGEGIMDAGEASGPDRLIDSGDVRYAVIEGRKYALPDTMAGPTGTNPAYQRALRGVLMDKVAPFLTRGGRRRGGEAQYERTGPNRRGAGAATQAAIGMQPGFGFLGPKNKARSAGLMAALDRMF